MLPNAAASENQEMNKRVDGVTSGIIVTQDIIKFFSVGVKISFYSRV